MPSGLSLGAQAHAVDLHDVDTVRSMLATRPASISLWRFHGLDLREFEAQLIQVTVVSGALFVGCILGDNAQLSLRRGGALIFPDIPELPFDPYPQHLYSGAELYSEEVLSGALEYSESVDGRSYAWSRAVDQHQDLSAALAATLHDFYMGRALETEISQASSPVVGVMGPHAAARDSAEYRQGAELGLSLAVKGFLVATGGGPGAMEAANLGALLAKQPELLDGALEQLAAVPSYNPDIALWARQAWQVLTQVSKPGHSIGVPTWAYGHEPPNIFASAIAKYFANALREAELVRLCTGGIVFMPGSAGTVQEIFQDACENFYAPAEQVAPMVLLGKQYWSQQLPAWPLLKALADRRTSTSEPVMAQKVFLVDSVAEAVQALAS